MHTSSSIYPKCQICGKEILDSVGWKHYFFRTKYLVCSEKCYKKWFNESGPGFNFRQSCLRNNGVSNPFQSPKFQRKRNKTMISRFGTKYPLQNPELMEKSINTCLKNNGVKHPCQNIDIFIKQQKSAFHLKVWIAPSGKEHKVQGYEPLALDLLISRGYQEEDFILDTKLKPKIWYLMEGKRHRYYPDIWIPRENLVVEVKSDYVMEVEKEQNKLKFTATTKTHNLLTLVFNDDGNLCSECFLTTYN